MTKPSDSFQKSKSFFHALGKTHVEENQYVFESAYKSSHNVKLDEIWSDTVDYALTDVDADTFATNNPSICTKHTQMSLTEISGSNHQAYYLDNAGVFIRPFISPVDIPHNTTNKPSYGYEVKLYKSDNSLVSPTTGVFVIDYYAGLVLFQNGYTPVDLGWGNPKITCYEYVGKTGVPITDNTIRKTGINENVSTVVDSFDKTSYIACLWDYVLYNGNNTRTGTIKACWNSLDNIEYYEDSTRDVGDTSLVGLSVIITGTNVSFNCLVSVGGGNGWGLVAVRKTLI